MSVETEEVELWWPNGHGGQTLYPLTVWVEDAGLATVHSETKQVAFRTLELVQEPLSRGLSFYFRVNGRPIFMKGSNWIPASVTPRYDESYYLQLLHSAREAHMNMLRVWGGGIYEYDQFYSLADQLGILIWQGSGSIETRRQSYVAHCRTSCSPARCTPPPPASWTRWRRRCGAR